MSITRPPVPFRLASEAGTLVVISAGNEGLAYDPSGGTTNVLGQLILGVDSGAVGASSTIGGALSVASVDNTKMYGTVMSYKVDAGDPLSFGVMKQAGAQRRAHLF